MTIDPDTILYTAASSLEEVARGFLQGMSAQEMFGDVAWQSIAPVLVSHVEEVGEPTYSTSPWRIPFADGIQFTCGDVARLIERMAKGGGA